jgi:putative methyltransferase (TIGR04325 family)
MAASRFLDRLTGRAGTPPDSAAEHRRFLDNTTENLFWGVHDSFSAAQAAAPTSRPVGYDNDASAELYSPQISAWDYPALFWLGRSLDEGLRSVFDLGGHIGIKFYAFKRLLAYPPELRWRVCDVPAVIGRGAEIARSKGAETQLGFTSNPLDASGFDVLYASGSLQYLPQTIGRMLDQMAIKPRRILLNTTAVHTERTYYTVNSIGTAFCPYRVQSHDELTGELVRHGYRRRDGWENAGKALIVPLTDGYSLDHYSGFCFDRST